MIFGRFKVRCIGVMLFIVTVAAGGVGDVAASRVDWAWQSVRVLSQGPDSHQRYDGLRSCNGGDIQVIKNNSDGNQYKACVHGQSSGGGSYGDTGGVRIARYFSPGTGYAYAVSLSVAAGFYDLHGVCDGIEKCVYSSEGDTLLAQTYLTSWLRGMTLFRNFSKGLSLQFGGMPLRVSYRFEATEAPYEVEAAGRVAAIESGTLSRNGRWAVVEVRSLGMIRIDTRTLQQRRVIAPGVEYGMGVDPAYELSISDDGRHLAIAGFRVGLSVVRIDETCGDSGGAEVGKYFFHTVTPCAYAALDTSLLFPNLFSVHYPTFDSEGERLTVVVLYRDGAITRATIAPLSVVSEQVPYMAFGDSFTSGEGETDDAYYSVGTNAVPHTCHNGVRAYPYLIALRWGIVPKSLACSGAQTADIIGDVPYNGQGGRVSGLGLDALSAARTDALQMFTPGVVRQAEFAKRYTPEIITLGIGGIDAGLMDKLQVCLGLDTCEWVRNVTSKLASSREIAEVYIRVRAVFAELRSASPGATIVYVGYPEVINDTAEAKCGTFLGALLNAEERVFMGEAIRYLNDVMSAAAQSEGVRFIDTETAFYGHRLCEGDSRAMNAVRYGDDIAPVSAIEKLTLIGAESFHPTPFGHSLVADRITQQLPEASFTATHLDAIETPVPEPGAYWRAEGVGTGSAGSSPVLAGGAASARQVRYSAVTDDAVDISSISVGVYSNDDTVDFTLKQGLMRPNSDVRMMLSPGNINLGVTTADSVGRVAMTAGFPSSIPKGYYAVHLLGVDVAGEGIDVYKVLGVGVGLGLGTGTGTESDGTGSAIVPVVSVAATPLAVGDDTNHRASEVTSGVTTGSALVGIGTGSGAGTGAGAGAGEGTGTGAGVLGVYTAPPSLAGLAIHKEKASVTPNSAGRGWPRAYVAIWVVAIICVVIAAIVWSAVCAVRAARAGEHNEDNA